jgi:hypothetical protein
MKGHTNPTVRMTEDNEQVGPKMHSALRLVASRGPYPSQNQLATSVGPNGSQDYGYRIVKRCIKKDLLQIHPDHETANVHGQGAVVLTAKGARYLNEHENMGLDPSECASAEISRWNLKDE